MSEVKEASAPAMTDELAAEGHCRLLVGGLRSAETRVNMMIAVCEHAIESDLTGELTVEMLMGISNALGSLEIKTAKLKEMLHRVSAIETNKLLERRERRLAARA